MTLQTILNYAEFTDDYVIVTLNTSPAVNLVIYAFDEKLLNSVTIP